MANRQDTVLAMALEEEQITPVMVAKVLKMDKSEACRHLNNLYKA